MRIPPGELDPETAANPVVVCRKAGLTVFHARVLVALERIAAYYDSLPPVKGSRRGDTDA